jgi:hypothetical protein
MVRTGIHSAKTSIAAAIHNDLANPTAENVMIAPGNS